MSGATTAEYKVTGMTCGHCEMSVREEVGEVAGVGAVEVSAQTGRLSSPATRPSMTTRSWLRLMRRGYSAVRIR